MVSMKRNERIFVAGHQGLVGAAVARRLAADGREVIAAPRAVLDLTDQTAVLAFFARERPDAVILAAARVGGILANAVYPAEFIVENLQIATNVIGAAHKAGIERLIYVASSAIYPCKAAQPICEDMLLTGPLDPTHEPYAIAKIAGIKLCESHNRQYGTDFRCLVPTSLYGPGDNFHPDHAHVVPALIRRFHEAAREGREEVVIWGSGRPRREILHVDDMAEAAVFALDLAKQGWRAHTMPLSGHVNVGLGSDVSIADIAAMIARATGFQGRIALDRLRPDGVVRRLLDVSRLAAMGWRARIDPATGIAQTCDWYRTNAGLIRGV